MQQLFPNRFHPLLRKIRHGMKWPLRIAAAFLLGMIGLVIMVFNPNLMYANATPVAGWEVLHEAPLQPGWALRIGEAKQILAQSEIYDADWPLQVALRDGSRFPGLMKALQGDAFAYGYSNKIVLLATADPVANRAKLNGETMDLSRLLAHEAVHCMQYHDLGFFHSNPVAGLPNWKWEGYAEHIARQNSGLGDLHQQIAWWQLYQETDGDGWVLLPDGTGVAAVLYEARLKVAFCMEVEGQSWRELLADPRPEATIDSLMLRWHGSAPL